jgi:hypothetical protein
LGWSDSGRPVGEIPKRVVGNFLHFQPSAIKEESLYFEIFVIFGCKEIPSDIGHRLFFLKQNRCLI